METRKEQHEIETLHSSGRCVASDSRPLCLQGTVASGCASVDVRPLTPMTKSDLFQLLSIHQQWFHMSCAASGMEMLVKWHKKKGEDWFGYQKEFQNENIGWSKKDRLAEFGIQAKDFRCDWDTFHQTLKNQSAQSRILLFSIPTIGLFDLIGQKWNGIGYHHIFVAAMFGEENLFVSKQFSNPHPIVIPDLKKSYDLIRQIDPNYTIDVLTYELS